MTIASLILLTALPAAASDGGLAGSRISTSLRSGAGISGQNPGLYANPPADRTPEVNYWHRLAVKRLRFWRYNEKRVVKLLHRLHVHLASQRKRSYGVHTSGDGCLDELIERESKWNVHATNPTTGAYGLPQALPGAKMASAGADWRDNARTQIRWMWGYVRGRYGGSCSALAFQKAHGWY